MSVSNLIWRDLYRIGVSAAVITAIMFGVTSAQKSACSMAPCYLDSTTGWFALLRENALLGLTYLSVFDIVNYALLGVIFIALFGALWRTNLGFMLVALGLGLVEVSVYFASNQSFALLNLSKRYATANTDTEQAL